MSFREDMLLKLDVDKDGKVTPRDALKAAEDAVGPVAVRWGSGGFIAGVIVTTISLFSIFK